MSQSRTVTVLFAAFIAASGLAAVTLPAQAGLAKAEYVVAASGAALAARGVAVVDDYGAFATARLSTLDVDDLGAVGIVATPLATGFGRGAFAATDAIPDELRADARTQRFLVQFRGPVMPGWRAALDARADRVYDYVPENAFLARLAPAARDALAAMPEVRAVVPYHPAFKIAPELPSSGAVDATVLAYPEESLARVLVDLALVGATPTAWAATDIEHVIDVTVDAEAIPAIARLEAVSWIEPAYDAAGLDNAQASAISQTGSTSAYKVHDKGVDGSTQILSVCDTGANTNPIANSLNVPGVGATPSLIRMVHEVHDDVAGTGLIAYNAHLFTTPTAPAALPPDAPPPPEPPAIPHRKIALYYSPQESGNRGDNDDTDGHGTHTSGTIAGDKLVYGARDGNDGVAFAARLAICDVTIGGAFQILNSYANYWNPAYNLGARVNSNSWGSSHTNVYTEKARQHDAYVWDHRDFLVLRSMGNTGSTGSIRPEAVAKSAMGIGATQNGAGMENVASFSTGGLTADGRMKPNVVAPGDCLTSSYLSGANSYQCVSGTSMSTPTVAGSAGLVRDYFKKGFYPSGSATSADALDASSALVRAVLQVSGKEISGDRGQTSFPNKAQGWGRVLLDDVLFFSGDARKLVVVDEGAGLSTGQTFTRTLTASAGQPLRIMLAWADFPGAAGANPALVNNLDLTVTGPGGTYRGNAFVGNQVTPNQGSADVRNVEEAVYVNAPAAGTYVVTVTAANAPSGLQKFALVATGDVA